MIGVAASLHLNYLIPKYTHYRSAFKRMRKKCAPPWGSILVRTTVEILAGGQNLFLRTSVGIFVAQKKLFLRTAVRIFAGGQTFSVRTSVGIFVKWKNLFLRTTVGI